MHEVLVNRLGGLSLPRKIVVRLTDRPDMTLDVYRGRKTTIQQDTTIMQENLPKAMKICYVQHSAGKYFFLFNYICCKMLWQPDCPKDS